MAPTSCRHTLIWSLPTLAVLLTFLWYKSRRGSSRSDPGGTAKGTRKAKKQEEKTTRVTASLLAEGSEKSVKKRICSTSREQTGIENCSTTAGTVGFDSGHPEVQQTEINIATKITEKSTVDNTVSCNRKNFSSDASKIASVGKNGQNSVAVVIKKCDTTTDNKNAQIELSDTYKQSGVVNINSDSRLSVEENSVSVEALSAHCDTNESNFEVETNCKGAASIAENSEIAVPKEIDSEVVCPSETDVGISAEIAVSGPKEIKYEITETLDDRALERDISTETHTEIAVTKEIIPEVATHKETNQVAVKKETNFEVTVEKETNSEVTASKETNTDSIVLQETDPGVAFPKNTIPELPVSKEINSGIVSAEETDCDIIDAQESVAEVTVPHGEDSKVVLTQETHSEITISQYHNPENISETCYSDTSKSAEEELSISSKFSDCSRVSHPNLFGAGGEECRSAEDLPNCSVLTVCSNLSDSDIEESTMPEPVKENWTLEKNSDVQAESSSETQRKDTGQTCVENKECPQNDSAASQSSRMQTPPPLKEVPGEVDAAATSSSCGLEGKLAALELGKGRDSANHSPAEVMLASPSASSYSDEGSSDSGKGCSDLATPPSRTPASGSSVSGDVTALSVYEFVLPQHLVGRLIGRHGAFVHQIKAKTNASILIKRHPDTQKLKICAVEGTQLDIESALEMIRKKFPLKHYPSITLEQVCFVPSAPIYPVLPECLQLSLVEGVSNDVILSSLVSPGHFFLQQPTHPTFPALNRLNACMNVCYSEPNVPILPTPIDPGVICAAPTMGGWYRAQVVSVEPETNMCEVKFVDYGGYLSLEHTALRQIRSDFMTLPFQASECLLANVVPAGGEEATWSADAAAVMEELTHGQVLQAQVCDYTEENVPNVFLYAIHCNQVVLVNQELVLRGLAEWWQSEEVNDVSCV